MTSKIRIARIRLLLPHILAIVSTTTIMTIDTAQKRIPKTKSKTKRSIKSPLTINVS